MSRPAGMTVRQASRPRASTHQHEPRRDHPPGSRLSPTIRSLGSRGPDASTDLACHDARPRLRGAAAGGSRGQGRAGQGRPGAHSGHAGPSPAPAGLPDPQLAAHARAPGTPRRPGQPDRAQHPAASGGRSPGETSPPAGKAVLKIPLPQAQTELQERSTAGRELARTKVTSLEHPPGPGFGSPSSPAIPALPDLAALCHYVSHWRTANLAWLRSSTAPLPRPKPSSPCSPPTNTSPPGHPAPHIRTPAGSRPGPTSSSKPAWPWPPTPTGPSSPSSATCNPQRPGRTPPHPAQSHRPRAAHRYRQSPPCRRLRNRHHRHPLAQPRPIPRPHHPPPTADQRARQDTDARQVEVTIQNRLVPTRPGKTRRT